MSTSVLAQLAEHYADRLALDWRRRSVLLRSPLADFPALRAWDERLEGAMDALRLLGPVARQHMTRCLDQPLHAGEVFALLSHALRNDLVELAEGTAAIACSVQKLQPALVAALDWTEPVPLWHHMVARLPLACRFDVAATRHGDAPGLLSSALAALRTAGPTPAPLAAGLRCLRHLGERTLAQAGLDHLDDHDERVRRQAAQAVLVLAPRAHRDRAVDVLLDLVRADGNQREPAARCLAVHQPGRLLPTLEDHHGRQGHEGARLHLKALGWSGDVAAVPRLIERLDSPAHARLAAASLRLLTGLCPVRDDWQGEPLHAASAASAVHADADSPDIPADDPDAGLPWPSRAAFAALWSGVRGRYGGTQTRLGGQPTTSDHLWTVLREGPLAWRPLAAAHLQRLSTGALFPTRQPARRQAALLNP